MKAAVVYSSQTGNTRKVAEAVRAAMPEGTELYAVEDAPAPDRFDLIAMGFWVDRGVADAKAAAYMQTIKEKKVFSFFTLGAFPDSEHARSCLEKTAQAYGEGCEVIGTFHCQGAVDPKLIEWMRQLPPDHPHAPNEERRRRWIEAAQHPNQADFDAAAEAVRKALAR
jgi:flavodoxin